MFLIEKIQHIYESITPFQAAMALSVIFLYILYLIVRDMDVPPGPKGLPLFGYWPFMKADTCHVQLQELSKKYGDVFSLRVTGKLFIYLGSLKAIKEAHVTNTECFAGRFSDGSILSLIFGQGVGFINGEPWKVLRKYFGSVFKEFGLNAVRENAASSFYDSMKEIVEDLRNTNGRPIVITDLITVKSSMIIRRILFSDQGITMEEFTELNTLYAEVMKGMTGTNMLLMGNIAKYIIFPLMPLYQRLKKSFRRIEEILLNVINRHKCEFNETQLVDVIDYYFKERNDRRERGDPTAAYFTDSALASSINQFLSDGVLSISVFVGCFLMTLVEHPEEQDKIYKEILEVVGQDRLPTLEDKSKLPYTNAFMYEVTRLSEFFPMFPSMECSKEFTLHGYKIPEGSITLLNMYAANRNPVNFENPDEFNPSRYIATPEKPRADLPILFGVGKRACMGEAFSMIQTFLFLTTIVQNFRLSLPENSQGSFMFWANERAKICVHPRSEKPH